MLEKFGKSGPVTLLVAFGGFFIVVFIAFKVLDMEFFRGDPDLGGEATAQQNERTALAHAHCARQVTNQLHLDPTGTHTRPEYTVWDLGFDRFLVKASVERTDDPGQVRHYLCRILYQGGAEEDARNWQVQSIEYVP